MLRRVDGANGHVVLGADPGPNNGRTRASECGVSHDDQSDNWTRPIKRTSPVTFERMTSRDNIVQYGLDDVRMSDVT